MFWFRSLNQAQNAEIQAKNLDESTIKDFAAQNMIKLCCYATYTLPFLKSCNPIEGILNEMIEMKSLTVFYSSGKVLLNYSLIQLHKCHLIRELVLTLYMGDKISIITRATPMENL